MDRFEYREKLKEFNFSEKYKKEMEFFISLISPQKHESILDYGCGLGAMINRIEKDCLVMGYDAVNYFDKTPSWFIDKPVEAIFDKIYFMHSFAHIFALNENVNNLPMQENGKLYIFTPNILYLSSLNDREYVRDPTVIHHWNADGLGKFIMDKGYEVLAQGGFGQVANNYHERIWLIGKKK